MVTIAEFHTQVKDSLGRGASLDTKIVQFTRRAARWIERNNTFQYMRRWVETETNPDSASPHLLSIYGTPLKKIEFLRYLGADGRFHKLNQIAPGDRATRITGTPTAFWLDGLANIVLDAVPDEALDIEGHFVQYSVWPTEDSAQHWLIDNAEDALLGRALMNAAIELRDERMYNANKTMLLEALQTLHAAEQDLTLGAAEMVMEWSPQHEEFDPNFGRTVGS